MGKREDNRSARRAQALDAARSIIAAEGVEGLSMRKLGAVSAMAVNTLYALFGSRQGVLEAVVVEGIHQRSAGVLERLDAASPFDALESLMRNSVRQAVADADYVRPMHRALSGLPHLRRAGATQAAMIITRVLSRAVERGGIEPQRDLSLLVEFVLRAYLELARQWAEAELDDERFEARSMYALYIALLGAATPASRPELERRMRDAERRLQASTAGPPRAEEGEGVD